MKTAAASVLAALAAVLPAGAQQYREPPARAAELGDGGLPAAAARARADAEDSKLRSSALVATLAAMNDGPEAGASVLGALDAARTDVLFAAQSEPEVVGTVDGRRAVLLSDALPAKPRVYAPLIAAGAAELLYADMPACAEREYMRAATAARAFAELGGDFKALPSVDGFDVPAVQAAVRAWTVDAETALDRIADERGLKTLPDLQAAAKDDAQRAALRAADARFVAFLLDERDARRSAGR